MTMFEEFDIEVLNDIILDHELCWKQKEVLKRAIEALEKQIPKKPIICDHSFEAYRCPKCSKCVGVYDLKHEKVIKAYYCSECGTKIDWSEGE